MAKESENLYRTLIEYFPGAVVIKDVEHRYVVVNDEFCRWYATDRENIIGKTAYDFVPKEIAEEFTKQERAVIDTKSVVQEERKVTYPDGNARYVFTQKLPIPGPDGECVAVGTVINDITERKRAEEELKGINAALQREVNQRKQIEEALLASEERFRDYVEAAHETVWEMDQDLRFTFSSRPSAKDAMTPPDLLGKTRWELACGDPDNDENWRRHRADMQARKPFRDFQHSMVHKDGRTHYWRVSGKPVYDDTGAFKGYRGTASDETVEIEAQIALRQSEERFRAVIEYSPGIVIIKDLKGQYLITNKTFSDWYKAGAENTQGKTVYDFLAKEHAEHVAANDRKVMETGAVIEEERRVTYPDGVIRDIFAQKFPIFGPDGSCFAIGTVINDITERKRADETLHRLAEAIDGLSENFALYGPDDGLVICNQGYRTLNEAIPEATRLGVSYEEHMRAVVARGLAPNAVGREEEYIQERMELHKNSRGPYEVIRQDSVWLVHEQQVADGSTALIATDITQLKRTEEALIAAKNEAEIASHAKSDFLAAMSHEFRTPLNAILGFSDIIIRQSFGLIGHGKYLEYAEDIRASGEHLLLLVNELLDISTIETGKILLAKERLPTLEMVTECTRFFAVEAQSKGVDLVIEVPESLPPLYADRRAFKQILLNLLSNALKFTPEGGTVTISAASDRRYVLTVADTGQGIPADLLRGLTDPFVRAHREPHLAEEGWGLGLTITKSLIELHDGKLELTSTVGEGTTVTVKIPNEIQ